MFLEASKILKKPLAGIEEQSKIGEICDILIDPDKGLVLGYLIKGGLLGDLKVLPISDIVSYDDEGVVTKTSENLIKPEAMERIQKLMGDNIKILDAPVSTESGERIGKVNDFIVDTQLGNITKYMISGINKSLIVDHDQIVEINPKQIIVKDGLEMPKETETAEIVA